MDDCLLRIAELCSDVETVGAIAQVARRYRMVARAWRQAHGLHETDGWHGVPATYKYYDETGRIIVPTTSWKLYIGGARQIRINRIHKWYVAKTSFCHAYFSANGSGCYAIHWNMAPKVYLSMSGNREYISAHNIDDEENWTRIIRIKNMIMNLTEKTMFSELPKIHRIMIAMSVKPA